MRNASFTGALALALAVCATCGAIAACADAPADVEEKPSASKLERCVTTIDLGNGFATAGALPADINEHGEVVGNGAFIDGSRHAFFWGGLGSAMIDLGTLGGRESDAYAMNDHGEIVGYATRAGGLGPRAVRWKDGVIEDLGTLGGEGGSASDVNDRGQIVGNAQISSGEAHAFLWEKGVMKDLGTLGGPTSEAVRINERGQIVGASETSRGELHGVLWSDGAAIDLGPVSPFTLDINERTEIVFDDEAGAFLWRDGQRTEVAAFGSNLTSLTAINAHGDIIGVASMPDGTDASFIRSNGTTTALAPFGMHSFVAALAINARAQVVGFASDDRDHGRAFSWQAGELTWLVPDDDDDSVASAVNDGGLVTGWARGGVKLWEVRDCSGN